jgi:hypothetical protein
MFRRYRSLAIVAVCVAVAVAALVPHGRVASADARPAAQPPMGRYQVFQTADKRDRLLDTATGKVWRLKDPNIAPTEWELVADGPK